MSSLSIDNVNTKLEAYKLIHDSTRLFSLLYSKYGEIEGDYFISFINQLMFNLPTKYNRIYKESIYTSNIQEFFRRYYRKKEIRDRIPKLSDYYKNYLKFFCRPFFLQFNLGKIVHNFQDKQAEIFYKNNYNETLDYEKEREKKEKENSDKKSSGELSSLDNITNNKIIFDDRTRKIIDNDLKNEMCTLNLESSRTNNIITVNQNNDNNIYKGELISKRTNDENSFEKIVHYLIHSQFKKKIENKNKISKKKLINSPSVHPPYIDNIFKSNYYNINSLNREIIPKSRKIKNSLYTLSKNNFARDGFNNYNKGFLSPKVTKNSININSNNIVYLKYENIKNYKSNSYMNSFQNFSKKNKSNYQNNAKNNNIKKFSKVTNTNRFNTNTIYKNFSNLSESLNKNKQLSFKNSNMTTFTNKNYSNVSKSKKICFANASNILTKSNNNISNSKKANKNENNIIDNIKLKQNNLNIPKSSNMNKFPFHQNKNKTFDFNSLYQNEHLTKIKTNNNFHNFRIFYNNKNQTKKKTNSKFSLIKKPITEVVSRIVSPSHNNNDNKISKERSISNNKEKTTKKIYFGLYQSKKNNNIKNNKFDSPKLFSISRKNITYNSDENNRNDNLNVNENIKIIKNNYKSNRMKIKDKTNYIKNKENAYSWKIKTSCPSPSSNYTNNYYKLLKKKINGSFNNTMKLEKYSSQKKEFKNSSKKSNNKRINNMKDNGKYICNISNRINSEFLEIMGDNLVFSRNKKHNTPKISSTTSQNDINLRDIGIKSIKNSNSNIVGKNDINNRIYKNKNKKNSNNNCNFSKINLSSELYQKQKKIILYNLNMKKNSIKKKTKKFTQGFSAKNTKKNFYRKEKRNINNSNKINVIFNGDVIINKNQLIEIRQNSLNNNFRNSKKDINKNRIVIINASNKDRGNSLKIINVNRNVNLINKKEQNSNI